MTGREKSSGQEIVAATPIDRLTTPAQRSDPTRIGDTPSTDGTVFDPDEVGAAPNRPSRETIFQPDSEPLPEPSGPQAAKSVRQASLLGAFDHVPYVSANPLIAAAAPVLMLLGTLPRLASDGALEPLRQHLADAIRQFERKTAEGGGAEDDARIAKYMLCETVDDIAGNLPGVDRTSWLEDGMLMRFFRAQTAGAGFYEALNAILADPETHCDLLEVAHACMALGFEGQYRGRTGGREALDRIRRDVYDTLRYFRPRAGPDISPQWEGLGATMAQRRRVPLWVIAAAVPALVGGVFLAARAAVADRVDVVVEALANLEPHGSATIRRPEFVAPVQSTPVPAQDVRPSPRDAQLDRLRQQLAAEIAGGTTAVATKGDFIVIEIGDDVLFNPGTVRLKPTFGMLARELAAIVDKEAGTITIVGHTDSQRPGTSSIFKSNYDLSVARAKAVKDILIRTVADPSRLRIDGKGDQDPVADNSTAEGRARNRRIDILIRRERPL